MKNITTWSRVAAKERKQKRRYRSENHLLKLKLCLYQHTINNISQAVDNPEFKVKQIKEHIELLEKSVADLDLT